MRNNPHDLSEEDLVDLQVYTYQKTIGGLTYEQVVNEPAFWVQYVNTLESIRNKSDE